MSRHLRTALALLLVVAASAASRAAQATVLEIPLPTLVGKYPIDATHVFVIRETTVVFPGHPAAIHSISVRVHGTTEVGVYDCGAYRGPTPWQTAITIFLGSGQLGMFNGPVAGNFGWTGSVVLPSGQTWASLVTAGQGTLQLWGQDDNVPIVEQPNCHPDTPYPTFTLDECTLILDADFAVPASPYSWGRLKAAYR